MNHINLFKYKNCGRCETTKKYECFSKNKNTRDKLNVWCKSCMSDYYGENRTIIKNRTQKWRESNPDAHVEYKKIWQKTEIGKTSHNNSNKKYKTTPKGRATNKSSKFRRRLKGEVTSSVILGIMEKYNNICVYCSNVATTIDHFVPLNKGGTHEEDNLVTACGSCNFSKGAKDPIEWMKLKKLDLSKIELKNAFAFYDRFYEIR
jgi:5-methylcytosine-specific restriction endonuclease McrA